MRCQRGHRSVRREEHWNTAPSLLLSSSSSSNETNPQPLFICRLHVGWFACCFVSNPTFTRLNYSIQLARLDASLSLLIGEHTTGPLPTWELQLISASVSTNIDCLYVCQSLTLDNQHQPKKRPCYKDIFTSQGLSSSVSKSQNILQYRRQPSDETILIAPAIHRRCDRNPQTPIWDKRTSETV